MQIDKPAYAGYITVKRELADKRTRSSCSITECARKALEEYVATFCCRNGQHLYPFKAESWIPLV